MPMKIWPSTNTASILRFIILGAIFVISLAYCLAIITFKHDKRLGSGIANMFESLNTHFDQIIRSAGPASQKESKLPLRKVEPRSVGSPETEAELLEFRHWVQTYELRFRKLPERSSDLQRLSKEHSLKAAEEISIENFAHKCQITIAYGTHSYLLNCDGAQLRDENTQRAIQTLDHETESFCVSGAHLFLYVPPTATPNRSK